MYLSKSTVCVLSHLGVDRAAGDMGDTAGVNGGILRLRLVELSVWRILHGINVIVRLGKTFVYARVCSFALTIVGRTCIGCMDHKQIIR